MSVVSVTIYQGILDSINKLFPYVEGFTLPELVYSDENPPEAQTYGNIKPDDIYSKLQELKKEFIEKYGSGNPKYSNYVERLTGEWARGNLIDILLTNDANLPPEIRELAKKVAKLLGRESVQLSIDAVYDSKLNKITVFTKAFAGLTEPEKTACIRRVIAHEVFHALHCFEAKDTYDENSPYAEVVREAMADFFSYVLCLDNDAAKTDGIAAAVSTAAAQKRYDFWRRYFLTAVPYANAVFHMFRRGKLGYDDDYVACESKGSIKKLQKIFELSKNDMYKAYITLVPEDFRVLPKKKQIVVKGVGKKTIGSGKLTVSDCSSTLTNFDIAVWDAIKWVIKTFNLASLEEVQEFFTSEVLEVVRGRFITLESGEIISAYPQLKIVSYYKFITFIEKLDSDCSCSCGHRVSRNLRQSFDGLGLRRVVEVEIDDGFEGSYLFDPEDKGLIDIGDIVLCNNRRGPSRHGTVSAVRELTEDEYREKCRSIDYPELSVAKRSNRKKTRRLEFKDDIVHFHCSHDGGFIYRDPITSHLEIDRESCNVSVYLTRPSGYYDCQTNYVIPKELSERFFEELIAANWSNSPFFRTAGPDCKMWHVEMKQESEKVIRAEGASGDGPKNSARIQDIIIEIITLSPEYESVKYIADVFGV